jgi:hypothetical protein
MGCEAINNYLAYESSRLSNWFGTKKVFPNSPELQLITREEYPTGMGTDFRYLTYERLAPTSILSWSSASAFSASGVGADCGACANSFNALDVGYTTRTATLYKYEVKSRMVCVEDFKWAWQVKQQLDAIKDQLGNWVKLAWEQRAREDMFTFTKYKVVCDGSIYGNNTATGATSYPAACATDVLQQALLDAYYAILYRDGAAEGGVGMDGGAPILPLVIGPEASRALLNQNANDRSDLHYGKPLELLKGLFVSKTYRNFAHVITPFPRRFTCAGGAYTEVAPFTSEAKTVLTGAELSAAYKNAPYEEATIWNRTVMNHMVPKPISSPGGGTSFDPVSYTGEWVWKNIADQDGTNVFNSQGRFYGRLFVSPRPLYPERGVSIVFRRCNPDLAAIPSTCVYS